MMPRLRFLFWNNLGHCHTCTGRALYLSLAGWTLVIILAMVSARWEARDLAFVMATGLTALWLSHIFVYSVKATEREAQQNSTPTGSRYLRREFIPLFARAVAMGVILSSAPKVALAQPACSMKGGICQGGCGGTNICRDVTQNGQHNCQCHV